MLHFQNVFSNKLKNVSFKINSGEFVLFFCEEPYPLFLLNELIVGHKKPEGGYIKIAGDFQNRNNLITLIWNKEGILLPERTIEENLLFILSFRGQCEGDFSKSAEQVLQEVDIGFLADEKVSRLMYHQKLRLRIARALLFNPVLMSIKWPGELLDEVNGRSLIFLLKQLSKKGITVLVFSTQKQVLSPEFDCKKILITKEKILSES